MTCSIFLGLLVFFVLFLFVCPQNSPKFGQIFKNILEAVDL